MDPVKEQPKPKRVIVAASSSCWRFQQSWNKCSVSKRKSIVAHTHVGSQTLCCIVNLKPASAWDCVSNRDLKSLEVLLQAVDGTLTRSCPIKRALVPVLMVCPLQCHNSYSSDQMNLLIFFCISALNWMLPQEEVVFMVVMQSLRHSYPES